MKNRDNYSINILHGIQGISLIEVLVALTLFSSVSLLALGSLMKSRQVAYEALMQVQAVQLG